MMATKHSCSRCGKEKTRECFSPSMWQNRTRADRHSICMDCESDREGFQCGICKETKPRNSFSASAMKHLKSENQNIRCYDCSHPPCMSLPNCMTCPTCRDPKCQSKNCDKPIRTLNSKFLPNSIAEVQSFACERCQYVRCIAMKPNGTRCGVMRSRKKQSQARQGKEDFMCSECRLAMPAMKRSQVEIL